MLSPSVTQIKNDLLTALVSNDYQHLVPQLESVDLSLGDVIYVADTKIEYVYFPETAVVSMLATLEDGATSEVGIIGREGMVGLTIFLAGVITPEQALVQLSGTAKRMKAADLRKELHLGSPLQLLLLHYTRAFIALVSQSVVCSQHHSVEQRFARWLLMMSDYAKSNELKLTQEMIAAMIGSRRAGISVAATGLSRLNLIQTSRGMVKVVDRDGLEAATCECYRIIRDEFDLLYASQKTNRMLQQNS
jgi:CRP-like cAMP-binding protein